MAANLYKHEDKHGVRYKIRYRLDGVHKGQWLAPGTTEPMAKVIAAKYNEALAIYSNNLGPFVDPLERNTSSKFTIMDARKWFFDNKVTAHQSGKAIDPKTRKQYEYAFNKLTQAINGKSSAEISRENLTKFEQYISQYSVDTKRTIIGYLRGAWKFLLEEEKVMKNPFLKVPISKKKRNPDIFTVEELDKIFSHLEHPDAILAFALTRYALLRPVDYMQSLKWEYIDWKNRIGKTDESKTEYNRYFPIHDELYKILLAHKKDNGYIISLGRRRLNELFQEAKQKARVNKEGQFTMIRHSSITRTVQC